MPFGGSWDKWLISPRQILKGEGTKGVHQREVEEEELGPFNL